MAQVQPKIFNSGGPKTLRYRVRKGDSLWKIASEQYSDPTMWHRISAENGLKNSDRILIGEVLRLPPVRSDTNKHPEPHRFASPIAKAPARLPIGWGWKLSLDRCCPKVVIPIPPSAELTFRLTGELAIEHNARSQMVEGSHSGIEFAYTDDVNETLNRFASSMKIKITKDRISLDYGGGASRGLSLEISPEGVARKTTYQIDPVNITLERGRWTIHGSLGMIVELTVKGDWPKEEWNPVPSILPKDPRAYLTFYCRFEDSDHPGRLRGVRERLSPSSQLGANAVRPPIHTLAP